MLVTTAFNRMLGLPGAWVTDVEFGAQAMIVTVALRRKLAVCSGCGARGLKIKDHRVKRWRHLDAGGVRCVIECRLCITDGRGRSACPFEQTKSTLLQSDTPGASPVRYGTRGGLPNSR